MKNSQLAYVSMLELCAQRFSHFMLESNQETLTEITSAASPALINWLNERVRHPTHIFIQICDLYDNLTQ